MEARALLLSLVLALNIPSNFTEVEKCGRPTGVIASAKIVGGFDVGYLKYPWFASLIRRSIPYCGGTLITARHIVTAAHCFKSFIQLGSPDQSNLQDVFEIQLGVYNSCATEKSRKSFRAKTVNVHEGYTKGQPYYDIALMTLAEEARGFEPCCLPKRELHSETRPKEGLIQGLGDQKYQSTEQTCTVHEARVLIYHDNTCRKMLDSVENNGSALAHAFCAGYLQGGIDACQGDSGGPLIILGRNSQYELQGITSFGFDCAAPKVLGVYTDVSHYLKWIEKKTDKQGGGTTDVSTTEETTTATSSVEASSPEISYGDNLTAPAFATTTTVLQSTIATSQQPEATTASQPETTSTVNWSLYPATPWIPSTTTFVPYQTTPTPPAPPHKKKKHHHHDTVIIININRSKNGSVGRKMERKRHHVNRRVKGKPRRVIN